MWFQRSVSDFMKTSAKRVNTESETTSWMTFSSQIEKGPPNSAEPRRLETVFEQGDAPAQEHDGHQAEALEFRLECDVAVPCQRHEGVGDDQQRDGKESAEHDWI